MASFVQTTSTNDTAYVLFAGEFGYVGENATLTRTTGTLVSAGAAGASIGLTVMGHLFAGSSSTIVGSGELLLTIGEGGSVTGNPTGVNSMIGGVSGKIVNYGLIASTSAQQAIDTSNDNGLTVINHGTISSPASSFGAVFYNGDGVLRLENFGTIDGDVRTSASPTALSVFNSGVINGGIYNPTTDAAVINRGLIVKKVDLLGDHDFYDGRGGRADGGVFGGDGDDTIYGGLGADTIEGGAGLDTIHFDAQDILHGLVDAGSGYDLGVNMDDTTPLTIFLGSHGFESYKGSAAAEHVLTAGTPQNFLPNIEGGGGDDTIEGDARNETLSGGVGDDLVNGYAGNDSIVGGVGADYLIGGLGTDTIHGGAGDDTIFGGDDADFSLSGGDGNDVIMGEAGNDTIYGGAGDDVWLDGGAGVDVIEGGEGNDLVRGEAGSDAWLFGGTGNDTIIGGAEADFLVGGGGSDQFQFYSLADAGDTIADFVSGADKLFIAQSGFGQLTGFISNGAPSPINGGPHLLYNTTTGVLTYDANGVSAGGQTVLATLSGAPTLLYEDLLFV